MLITFLSKFDRKRKRNKTSVDRKNNENHIMSRGGKNYTPTNGQAGDDWQHVSVLPINDEEDFEFVYQTPDLLQVYQEQTAAAAGIASETRQTTTTTTTSSSRSPPRQRQGETSAGSRVSAVFSNENNNDATPSLVSRMQMWRQQRQTQRQSQRSQLGESITATFAELSRERPDQMEEDAIKRAIELSMLDFALVDYQPDAVGASSQINKTVRPAHEILGVPELASPAEIRKKYRELALLNHPDKGGDANRFAEIARAYRSLLSSTVTGGALDGSCHHHDHTSQGVNIKSTAHWDQELQDHRRLVNELFQADGMDLDACISKQLSALDFLGLTFKDAGASNRNERNEIIRNSCFYLSLATSYLWGIGALSFRDDNNGDSDDWLDESDQELLVGETALQLKRTIEAAVVKAHPEWCLQGKVGEEVQAFSDFLVYSLDSQTVLSEWAVVVFDSESGFCDIYKGQAYDKLSETDPAWGQSNTITLRYLPGHYQPLIPVHSGARRPSLKDILTALDHHAVFYVVTDGNS
mmetsp:Transcript_33275/g.55706  ORF Transcript_33275/g.55706 Transcript_33275/m.55706 type:complete len:525 (+) Transcript_33275:131-1705(+)